MLKANACWIAEMHSRNGQGYPLPCGVVLVKSRRSITDVVEKIANWSGTEMVSCNEIINEPTYSVYRVVLKDPKSTSTKDDTWQFEVLIRQQIFADAPMYATEWLTMRDLGKHGFVVLYGDHEYQYKLLSCLFLATLNGIVDHKFFLQLAKTIPEKGDVVWVGDLSTHDLLWEIFSYNYKLLVEKPSDELVSLFLKHISFEDDDGTNKALVTVFANESFEEAAQEHFGVEIFFSSERMEADYYAINAEHALTAGDVL